MLPQLLVDLLLPVRGEMDARKSVGNRIYLAISQIFEDIQQGAARLGQQVGFVGWERGVEQIAFIGDAVVHKELVQRDILHHAGDIGVAGVGEIVAGLPFVLRPDAGAAALRMEIGDRQRPRAVERIDGVLRQVDGVHRVGGVPVIDQLAESKLLEERSVEGEAPWGGVLVAGLLDGAVLRPVLEQHIGNGEQMPQFGVLQLAAEVGRAPVAAVAHLAGHAVVDVEALGEFLAADGSHEEDGFHAQGGKRLQRGLALASDDHQCGGVPQRTEDEVGIEGEAADVACLLREVAVAADAPGHQARLAAEEDPAPFLAEHIADGEVVGRVLLVDEGFSGGEEPVVEFAQGDLVVQILVREVAAFVPVQQVDGVRFVVGEVELLGEFGHDIVEVLGSGVAQDDGHVGDVSVVADLEVPPRGLVGEAAAHRLQTVGLEEGGGFSDEDDTAAVGEGSRGDGLVVHPEVLAEVVIEGVRLLEGEGGFQVHILVGDILFFEEDGGLLFDALGHLAVPSENGERADGEE